MAKFNKTDTVGIIGAGISGLTAAYKLSKQGISVTLFEKQDYIGGQMAAINIEGSLLEVFYHHSFSSDESLWELCEELNISDKVLWLESKIGYYTEQGLYEFGTPLSLLKFKPLSFIDRIRFGLSVLKLRSIDDIEYTKNFTAEEWFIKYAGKQVWNIIWKPLFQLKYGDVYDQISLTWIWDKLRIRGNSRNKGGLKEKLAYMEGSYFLICKRLEEEILNKNVSIYKNTSVDKIEKQGDKFLLYTSNGIKEFDKVFSTTSSEIMQELYDFSPNYRKKLADLEYCAVICAILVSKKPLSNFYWMNIGDQSLPFGGIIEQTNFYDKSHYNNKQVIYISRYLSPDNTYYNCSNDQILDLYYEELKKINHEFDKSWIEEARVYKQKYAQPIVRKGYVVPDMQTEIEGLYWLSTHHNYPHDRGINYSIKLALEFANLFEK